MHKYEPIQCQIGFTAVSDLRHWLQKYHIFDKYTVENTVFGTWSEVKLALN